MYFKPFSLLSFLSSSGSWSQVPWKATSTAVRVHRKKRTVNLFLPWNPVKRQRLNSPKFK